MIELIIAFGAGLISFLSPCVLPLIPGYVSFITGSTLSEILEKKKIDLLPLIVFSLGFSFVFIIFGATASFLGQILLQNSQILRIIAGVIIIIFSLQLIGVLNIKFLNIEKKFYTKKSNNIFFIFIVGMAFGFGWTPCIGPALAAVQTLAFQESSAVRGAVLSFGYCLGLGLPFILSGLFLDKSAKLRSLIYRRGDVISKIGGVFLIAIGALQVLGFWGQLLNSMRSLISDFIPVI